jgi:hypothetical protein
VHTVNPDADAAGGHVMGTLMSIEDDVGRIHVKVRVVAAVQWLIAHYVSGLISNSVLRFIFILYIDSNALVAGNSQGSGLLGASYELHIS